VAEFVLVAGALAFIAIGVTLIRRRAAIADAQRRWARSSVSHSSLLNAERVERQRESLAGPAGAFERGVVVVFGGWFVLAGLIVLGTALTR